MGLDELCECVVALQSRVGEIALPHILEDDMSKIRSFHGARCCRSLLKKSIWQSAADSVLRHMKNERADGLLLEMTHPVLPQITP